MAVQVFVRWFDGKVFSVSVCDTEEQLKSITVLELKKKIREIKNYPEIEGGYLELTFQDTWLKDSALLSDYKIGNMSMINAQEARVMLHAMRAVDRIVLQPAKLDDGMGDKDKNRSMERLSFF